MEEHNWAFVSHFWTPQHTSSFGGVLAPHMRGGNKEIGGPNRPHAGRLKCARNPDKTLKIHAMGSVCDCEYQCW